MPNKQVQNQPNQPKKKKKWKGCCIAGVVLFVIVVGLGSWFSYEVYQQTEENRLAEEADKRIMGEGEPVQEAQETNTYKVKQQYVVTNTGQNNASRIEAYVALIQDREPYQRVLNMEIHPDDYELIEDEFGNQYARFDFVYSLRPNERFVIDTNYLVEASEVKNYLGDCTGETINEYLLAERWIESDDQEIIDLASQITADKSNDCEKTQAIYNFVADNITYELTDENQGAIGTLNRKIADCDGFADLFIALSRASGVPARTINGFTYKAPSTDTNTNQEEEIENTDILHAWAEVYLPGTGWTPVDATWGQKEAKRDQHFSRTDAKHIILDRGRNLIRDKFVSDITFSYWAYNWWNESGGTTTLESDEEITVDLIE